MDLSNLFVVKSPKKETSVLIRLGRVMHYALSLIGWIWISAAIYYTIDNGRIPNTFSDEVAFVMIGAFCMLVGRGMRYVLSGE